jgi:hypothetical protein
VAEEKKKKKKTYPPLPPARLLRSTLANPAMFTSTSTIAPALPAWPDPSPRRPSAGPWTEHMIAVLPIERYDEPELAGLVEIWACSRRSSFHRRPSRRSRVRGYVVEVSRGILREYVVFSKYKLGSGDREKVSAQSKSQPLIKSKIMK